MNVLIRLAGLLLALALGQLLAGCAFQGWEATLASPIDSTIQRQLSSQVLARNVKFNGPVTIQVGGSGNTANATDASKAKAPVATGTSQAQDNTKAGQHGGAAGLAPGASADATTRTGVPVWVLAVGGIILVLLALLGLAYRYRSKLTGLFLNR